MKHWHLFFDFFSFPFHNLVLCHQHHQVPLALSVGPRSENALGIRLPFSLLLSGGHGCNIRTELSGIDSQESEHVNIQNKRHV